MSDLGRILMAEADAGSNLGELPGGFLGDGLDRFFGSERFRVEEDATEGFEILRLGEVVK